MPLFSNLIFKKLSFNEKLDLMKIKLLAKCYMELKFYVIFYFLFLSFLPITRFSKNRVFHWNLFFRKSSLKHTHMAKWFQKRSILLLVLDERDKCLFWPPMSIWLVPFLRLGGLSKYKYFSPYKIEKILTFKIK